MKADSRGNNHVVTASAESVRHVRGRGLAGSALVVARASAAGGAGTPSVRSWSASPARRATSRRDGSFTYDGQISAVCMADVPSARPAFLWHPYAPRGCLTIVEGEPGAKKSYLTLQLAADVSMGRNILGADTCIAASNVLLLSAEDHLGATVKRRLRAMAADEDRIFAIDRPFNLAEESGWQGFLGLLDEHAPALVVVDTMHVYIAVADSKVRPVLAKLAALARERDAAIVLVRHLRKSGGTATNQGYGSIHYTGAVRSVLAVLKNPLDGGESILVHSKSNLTEPGPLVVFRLANGALVRVHDSPLTPEHLTKPAQCERLEEARAFLLEALRDGPRPASTIKRRATAEGVTQATLRRAKASLALVVHKRGNRGQWTWGLTDDRERAHTQ